VPTYIGSISKDAKFNPKNLTGTIFQIKIKMAGDWAAERALRPVGIPRDLYRTLPYLGVLIEFGTESLYKESKSKILVTASTRPEHGTLERLTIDWVAAVAALETFEAQKSQDKKKHVQLKKNVDDARKQMDSCYRFTLSIRGSSSEVYGILQKTNIEFQFQKFLKSASRSSTDNEAIQNAMPLEHLDATSGYAIWMRDYILDNDDNNEEARGKDKDEGEDIEMT
jgi:hypothetical protein